jgi:hypothetical protein
MNTRNWQWRIQGFDSTTKIFETKASLGQFTHDGIKSLLKTLAAKHGLRDTEIVGAYAKRGTKIANDFLSVRRDGPQPTFKCGLNPHFIASLIDQNGKVVKHELSD